MLIILIAAVAIFFINLDGLTLINYQSGWADLLMGRMYYWLQTPSFQGVADISAPLVKLFPVFPLIFYMYLVVAALFSLLALDW